MRARLNSTAVISVGLFVVVLAVFVATANLHPTTESVNDWEFTALPAWTLARHGSLNLDLVHAVTHAGWQFQVGDHWRSDRLPGAVLFAVPFYWIGGSAAFSAAPSAVAAAVSAALAVVFLYRALLPVVSPRVALTAAVIAAFCTPMWSEAGDSLWTDGPMVMGLGLAMWAMSRSAYVTSGVGYAIAILARPPSAVFAATSGLWASVRQRSVMPALKVAAISVLGLLALLAYNRINADTWTLFPGSYSGRVAGAVSTSSHGRAHVEVWLSSVGATIFSPFRGILIYCPFLLLLVPGLWRAWKVAPEWVRSSAVGGVIYLLVQLAENGWQGGTGFYAFRIAIGMLFGAAPLLALCWQEWTARAVWRRNAFGGLVALSMWSFAVVSTVSNARLAPPAGSLYMPPWTHWAVPDVLGATNAMVWILSALFVVVVGSALWAVEHRQLWPTRGAVVSAPTAGGSSAKGSAKKAFAPAGSTGASATKAMPPRAKVGSGRTPVKRGR